MARQRTGTPIGPLANTLIADQWGEYRAVYKPVGKPQPKSDRGGLRVKDYPAFFNNMLGMPLGVEPGTKDATGLNYKDVRKFADEHEITRTVIETCKDQLCKLRWTWRRIPKPGESIEEVRAASENDIRVKKLNDFFDSPDKEFSFEQWLRMLLEEIMVCDAVPIYNHETLIGTPYAIRLIDTETIRRCVNDMGVTPSPDLPHPYNIAYQQIIDSVVTAEFTTNEMIYYIRNPRVWAFFGYSPVEQIIMTLATGMRRMAMQIAHYTDGNIPAMFMRAPKEWTLQQIKDFQSYWNELLSGNYGDLAKGWMIPGDVEPVFPQKETLKDEFDEWIARVVCYAFSVSPTPFIKNMNRATSEQSREQADEEGLQTRMRIVSSIMNQIQKKWFGYRDIEFHLIVDRPQDSKKQAEIDNLDVRNGIKSLDEIRRERGYAAIGAPNRVYTTNGYIPLTKGDEPNFDIFRQELLGQDKNKEPGADETSTDKDKKDKDNA